MCGQQLLEPEYPTVDLANRSCTRHVNKVFRIQFLTWAEQKSGNCIRLAQYTNPLPDHRRNTAAETMQYVRSGFRRTACPGHFSNLDGILSDVADTCSSASPESPECEKEGAR
jgi:hypothetical protein